MNRKNEKRPAMRKVYVTNIPVNAYLAAWVEVPADTKEEDLTRTLAEAIAAGDVEYEKASLDVAEDVELDATMLDMWEFDTPLEER